MTTLIRWGCACALAWLLAPGAQAAIRVALLGSDLSESGAAALALAEAELSGRADLEWLDRSTISQVLREQHLAAEGFARPEDAIRIGQLLAVDVFIHAEAIPGEKALGVAAFETVQGIRLLDRTVAGAEPDALARALAAAADAALAKWRAPAGQATAIALMGVRNVDLPKSRTGECEALGALLERRLLGSPDVVVVERKRLESLNRDHEITMSRPEERLLSVPVLLELDLSQSGSGNGLRATAFLSDPNGAELGSVDAEAPALPALADQLAAEIMRALQKGVAAAPANPVLEAARFFQMARFWTVQGHPDLALAAAEAAFALEPTNALMAVLLANALFDMANATRDIDRLDSLDYAARGAALLRREYGVQTFNDPELTKQYEQLNAAINAFFRGYGENITKQRVGKPFTKDEAEIYAMFCDRWLAQSPFSPESDMVPSGWDLILFVNCFYHYFPDQASAWRVLAWQVKRWSQGRRQTEPPLIPGAMLSRLVRGIDSGQKPPDVGVCRIRSDLWTFFERHEDPLFQLYGRCGRIMDAYWLSEAGDGAEEAAAQEFLSDLYADLLAQNVSRGIFREQMYQVARLVIHRQGQQGDVENARRQKAMQQQLLESTALFRVMLKTGDVRRDFDIEYRQLLLNYYSSETRPSFEAWLGEMDAAMAEASTNEMTAFDSWEVDELKKFRDWVQAKGMPENRKPQSEISSTIVSLEMSKLQGRFAGIESILGDQEGACVLSAYEDPCRLFLQKCHYGTRAMVPLGIADLREPLCNNREKDIITDVCLMSNDIAVAVKNEGVFIFSRKSPLVEALHETTTLPVTHPLSVGVLDQRLYVGTDDGYLVAVDMNTLEGEVLAAAARKGKMSPFDDGPPVHISAIFPDSARGRIVFVASVMEARGDLGIGEESDLNGIWEYRPGTAEFKQLIEWTHRSGHLRWCEKVRDNIFVLSDIWGLVLWYDMESDTLDLLVHGENGNIYDQQLAQRAGLCNLPPDIVPIRQRDASISPPFMVCGDWLWTAVPLGRLSIKTYKWEEFPRALMPDGTARGVYPTIGMMPFGDRQTLLAERKQLWLMTVDDAP